MTPIIIPIPSLVILCGPASSGKSTFAAKHFPRASIVSSDRCREMVADDEGAIWASPEAFAVFHQIIEARSGFGRLTVADSTAVQPEARKTLIRIARRLGIPTVLIAFHIPEDICLQRDRHRARHVDAAVIHQQCVAFQRALDDMGAEGYRQVVVLTAADLDRVSVELVPGTERRVDRTRSRPHHARGGRHHR